MTEFVDQILTIRTVLSQTILCIENSDTIHILWFNLRVMAIPNVHWGQVLMLIWNLERGRVSQLGLVLYVWEYLVRIEDALEFSMQFSCNPRVRYVRINLCLDQTVSFCSECEVWVCGLLHPEAIGIHWGTVNVEWWPPLSKWGFIELTQNFLIDMIWIQLFHNETSLLNKTTHTSSQVGLGGSFWNRQTY